MIDSCGTVHGPTNVRKQVTSNDACSPYQRYTDDWVFWLVPMMLCVITLCYSLPFVVMKCHFRWSDKWLVDLSINVSTTYLSDHLKWCFVLQNGENIGRHNACHLGQLEDHIFFCWLAHTYTMFDVLSCFFGASVVNSSALLIC